jgi:predicted aspartyl protease
MEQDYAPVHKLKWNRLTLALSLTAAALATPLAVASSASASCQMIQNADLDVRFSNNRPLVEASINGKPVWIEVDTGAYSSVLFTGAAERLGLSKYSTGNRLSGVGGAVDVMRTDIAEFALGKAKVKNFGMNIAGGVNIRGGVRGDDRPIVGLLGRDFLGLGDLELDLAAHKMRILTFKDCGSRSLAYWTDAPSFVEMGRSRTFTQEAFHFPLTINGYPVRAMLDSGAVTTVVSPAVAAHAGVAQADFKEAGRGAGIGNKTVVRYKATFSNIDLGDEKIKTAELAVTDLGGREEGPSIGTRTGGGGLPMLLGADFLHSHHVLIASSQDRIYFTYNGGPVFNQVSSDRPVPMSPPPTQPPASGTP